MPQCLSRMRVGSPAAFAAAANARWSGTPQVQDALFRPCLPASLGYRSGSAESAACCTVSDGSDADSAFTVGGHSFQLTSMRLSRRHFLTKSVAVSSGTALAFQFEEEVQIALNALDRTKQRDRLWCA